MTFVKVREETNMPLEFDFTKLAIRLMKINILGITVYLSYEDRKM